MLVNFTCFGIFSVINMEHSNWSLIVGQIPSLWVAKYFRQWLCESQKHAIANGIKAYVEREKTMKSRSNVFSFKC